MAFVRGTIAFILFTSVLQAGDVTLHDTWSLAKLQGQSVGYEHSQVIAHSSKSEIRYIFTIDRVLKVKRAGMELLVHSTSRTLESADGTVVDFEKNEEEGGSPLVTRGYREGEQLVVLERGNEQHYPMPKEALGPRAAQNKINSIVLHPGSTLEFLAFEEDFPQAPVKIKEEVITKQSHSTIHGDQDLWKIKVTMDSMPGIELTEWVDDSGQTVISEFPFAGSGNLELSICSKEEAMKPISGGEISSTNIIVPDKILNDYRKLHEAQYHISGSEKLTVVSGAEQTVTTLADNSLWVTVQVPTYSEDAITWFIPATVTPELQPYLMASSFMQIEDPSVQDLAKKAVGSETNPLRVARKIESFVRDYITTKDLSVGFASAADTVKSRTGDCTEHAVLAAALGRAVGLPTRVVMGLGYLPPSSNDSSVNSKGTFGFHMWAEAYLGTNQWVAMDSALGGFDVGHIAFVKTDLGTSADRDAAFLPIMQMVGKLKIEVVEMK